MSDITGYTQAAEVLDTRQEKYEELSDICAELPDGFRAVELSGRNADSPYRVEKRTKYNPKWVPIARFTEPDAKYEWADDIADSSGKEYRCVVDHSEGEVYLEVLIEDE
jgi:hypothetical protein